MMNDECVIWRFRKDGILLSLDTLIPGVGKQLFEKIVPYSTFEHKSIQVQLCRVEPVFEPISGVLQGLDFEVKEITAPTLEESKPHKNTNHARRSSPLNLVPLGSVLSPRYHIRVQLFVDKKSFYIQSERAKVHKLISLPASDFADIHDWLKTLPLPMKYVDIYRRLESEGKFRVSHLWSTLLVAQCLRTLDWGACTNSLGVKDQATMVTRGPNCSKSLASIMHPKIPDFFED